MKKLLLLTLMSFIAGNAFAMPNPASKNCVDKGGKLEIVTDKNGNQSGMCHLPNGVVCEEFALLRNECRATPELTKPGGYKSVSVNDPEVKNAANFAAQQITKGKAKLTQVTAARRQVVSGFNYEVAIQLSNGQRYKATVYKSLPPSKLKLTSVTKL
jgi:hypothetical protein